MKSDPILRCPAGGRFPLSSTEREDGVLYEITEWRSLRHGNLRRVDRTKNLREVRLCFRLRHLRYQTEHFVATVTVVPPLADPHPTCRPPNFLYTTFLKPFRHETLLLCSCVDDPHS